MTHPLTRGGTDLIMSAAKQQIVNGQTKGDNADAQNGLFGIVPAQ